MPSVANFQPTKASGTRSMVFAEAWSSQSAITSRASYPCPPDTVSPLAGPLFDDIVMRLFDSFNLDHPSTGLPRYMDPSLSDNSRARVVRVTIRYGLAQLSGPRSIRTFPQISQRLSKR
jgi:hypothetical protein